ncbi:MAG: PIN domain-containing protein [Thermomicrobiales bacterium]
MDIAPTHPAAVLDANVLFSGALCDLLMRAAIAGLYQAFWNETILDEVERNLIRQRRATPEQARRRRDNMQRALPHATVQSYEAHIAAMTNDAKDRHILATAVHIGAQIIVTHNRRHFPSHALSPHGIEVRSPDTFLRLLLDRAPDAMIRIITEQSEDLKNPPQSVQQVLNNLSLEAPAFTDAVRNRLRHR